MPIRLLLLGWVAMASAAAAGGDFGTYKVERGASTIEVAATGTGPLVVMLPSAGRGNEDLMQVARKVAKAGFRVALPQPRGAGGSVGPENATLHDLADDVAAVIRHEGARPAVVLGHAYGNFVARVLATDHPELVRGVILAAAGRRAVAGGPEDAEAARLSQAVATVNDPRSTREQRLLALRFAFFAPGHDPSRWLEGWYPTVFRIETRARAATPPGGWWLAGAAPILEIQSEQDPFRPPSTANELRDAASGRVTIVRIVHASHALFPEQPDGVARAIVKWTRGLEPFAPLNVRRTR